MPVIIEKETRSYPIDLRVTREAAKPPRIVGHAAVFDQLSEDLGGFREKVVKGAFRKTLREADVRALLNHDSNYVLGRNTAGTLRVKEDKEGLAVDIDPPDTTWARDLLVSMERGDINQMSFGFRVVKEEWDDTDKANVVRTLSEVELFDVSPVTYPAYPQTSVSVKRHLEQLQSEPVGGHSDEAHEPGEDSHSTWLATARAALTKISRDNEGEKL
jgi:HK97 family phage prohead protease